MGEAGRAIGGTDITGYELQVRTVAVTPNLFSTPSTERDETDATTFRIPMKTTPAGNSLLISNLPVTSPGLHTPQPA